MAFLSACISPEAPVLSEPAVALEVHDRFLPPLRVAAGGDIETSLAVSGDGATLLACSHGGFTQPSPFWASIDRGATFKRFDPQPNPLVSGDCDVAIGGDGSWYMIYDTVASTTVAATRDNGRTWSFAYLAAIPFGGVDRPWIAAVGPTTVYLTYANVMVAEPAIDVFAKSTDGGRTWLEHRPFSVTEPPSRINTVVGHMFLADEGRTIRIPLDRFSQATTGPHFIEFATSRDGGATWSRDRLAGPHESPLNLPAATRAGDGTLYLVYPVGSTERARVQFIFSVNDGQTWSAPILIMDNVTFPGLSGMWVDGRPDGSATSAWMHSLSTGNGTAWVVTVAKLRPSLLEPIEFIGPLFDPLVGSLGLYEFLMLRHDAEGRAYILYPFFGRACAQKPAISVPDRNEHCVMLAVERPEPRL